MTIEFTMKTLQMILDFVKFSNEFTDNVELKTKNITVDGKSILGVLSIGVPTKVTVVFQSDNQIALGLFNKYMNKLVSDYENVDYRE